MCGRVCTQGMCTSEECASRYNLTPDQYKCRKGKKWKRGGRVTSVSSEVKMCAWAETGQNLFQIIRFFKGGGGPHNLVTTMNFNLKE